MLINAPRFTNLLVALALVGLAATDSFAQTKRFVTEPLPPFNYLDNGEVAGPSYEIIRAVCAEMEIECSFEITRWEHAIEAARNAEVNGIFSIGKRTDRLEWMYFSVPILETAYGIYVSSKNPLAYEQASDLAGYEIITYGPSNMSRSAESLAAAEPTIQVTVETKLKLAVRKFNFGRYGTQTALYLNKDVVNSLTEELDLNNIRYAGDDKVLRYFVGFPKKANPEQFVSDFNRVLESFKADGTLEGILSPFGMTPPQ